MLFRSTGLGKTELTGHISGLERQGDYMVMFIDVTDPVKWRIRGGLSMKDLGKLIKVMMKASIIGFIVNPFNWFNKNPKHPGEF